MSKKPDSNHKTVGVFLAQVSRIWGREFMAGVNDEAYANNINLVCFVGGTPESILTPNQQTYSFGLYDLAKSAKLDGALFASDIGYGLKYKEISAFCQSFAPLPMVAHGIDAEGIPNLRADSLTGMREVIRHLIEAHGCNRIAFIRGVAGQIEAEERFQAYHEELQAHSIRYDEKLVVQGDFSPESGRAAIRTLMDGRGMRFQAVAAANDHMAFGALEALQMRGIQVPNSVALTGFDDVDEAQSLGVPLTTVQQSFYDQGREVFRMLMRSMNGEAIEPVIKTPTKMIIRWSCGCLPETVQKAVVLPREVAQTGRLQNKRDAAIEALLGVAHVAKQDINIKKYRDVFGNMWDSILTSIHDSSHDNEFLKTTNAAIELLHREGRAPSIWHNVISMMRRYTLGGISSDNQTTMLRAENLFQQARLLTGELSQRAQAYNRLQREKQESILQAFGFSMAPAMSLDEIGEAIKQNFPAMGIDRWYVMFHTDSGSPDSAVLTSPENYRLLFTYEENKFHIPTKTTNLDVGKFILRGKTPQEHRITAVVMPLSLASNRFGFMWAEMGTDDWDVYTRIRNLVSSALLRVMLVQQREQAQKEIERLLDEARERAIELAVARDIAEKAAIDKEKMYAMEQYRRRSAEALARAARQLSSLEKLERVPQQILEQLRTILPFDRGVLFLEDIDGVPYVAAHYGLPANAPIKELRYLAQSDDMYSAVANMKEPIQIGDVQILKGWQQPDWLPTDSSWMGAPLYFKDKVMGMLVLTRAKAFSYNKDDALLINTYAVQAAIALENARLYDELNRFNQMMERLVEQRVEELNNALSTLEKLDQNKSTFIQVAAHELRTPLTVIKGYLGMLSGESAVQSSPAILQAVDGVMQGANRLHQIVNSMLDVARLENQVLIPHLDRLPIAPLFRLIQKDYQHELEARNINLYLDESLRQFPPLKIDPELMQKALDNIIVNAIKYTPDGGSVTVSGMTVTDEQLGSCAEVCIRDTGIGIDPANLQIIFEKLYQLGKVELHSSGRTSFKGGGPGLGLAIAAGIIKAHGGKIWAESAGFNETTCPGSAFFIRLQLPKGTANLPKVP